MAGSSLAQELAQLANSAPVFSDPEDDIGNETVAKVTSGAVDDVNNGEARSALRRKSVALLSEEDQRYAGRKVSRRALHSSDEESDGDLGGQLSDEVESDGAASSLDYEFTGDESLSPVKVDPLDDAGSDGVDSEVDDSDDDGSYYDQFDMDLSAFAKGTRLADDSVADDSNIENEDSDEEGSETSDQEMTTLKAPTPNDDVKRGQAVQNQIKLWEMLLELRIEIQKLLNASNQLPQHDTWHQLCDKNSTDSQRLSTQTLSEVEHSCLTLSSELLSLQTAIEGADSPVSLKRGLEEVEQSATDQYADSQVKRNDVIQKWDEKTRLSVAATSKRRRVDTGQQSTLNKIQHILADKDRLLSRARQNRSNVHIIGGRVKEPSEQHDGEHPAHDEKVKADPKDNTNVEIFNDDDFYHQLLRELIEQRTSKSEDPVAMSRQWLEFQALRKKIKRTVDTRASKGRKLRYNVMPKLVNFMAPIVSAQEWDDSRKDELFASLFDKKPEYKVLEESNGIVILA